MFYCVETPGNDGRKIILSSAWTLQLNVGPRWLCSIPISTTDSFGACMIIVNVFSEGVVLRLTRERDSVSDSASESTY